MKKLPNNMPSKWKTFDYNHHPIHTISNKPGCYAIYCDGELVYIGQSANVQKRLKAYDFNYTRYSNTDIHTPWGLCKKLVIKVRKSVCYGDWAMVELRLIRKLQPKFNCVGSTKTKGQIFDKWSRISEQ